jgi:acyl-CoA synthetase
MHVRLLDDDDRDVTEPGVPGNPVCRGPATGFGYLDDDDANRRLFTPDGWMRIGDVCELDADGYLRVVGRTSDLIIRGGKNISAPTVEAEVATHPAVAVAAAVPMPDEVFGERVCVYVELVDGAALELDELVAHLRERGVSREWFPERLVVLDALPRASGGKIAKSELRTRAGTWAQKS